MAAQTGRPVRSRPRQVREPMPMLIDSASGTDCHQLCAGPLEGPAPLICRSESRATHGRDFDLDNGTDWIRPTSLSLTPEHPTLNSATPGLQLMLRHAASARGWAGVIRRCAWCRRAFDERGVGEILVIVDESTVVTDGMCPPCGRRNLGLVAGRRVARALQVA